MEKPRPHPGVQRERGGRGPASTARQLTRQRRLGRHPGACRDPAATLAIYALDCGSRRNGDSRHLVVARSIHPARCSAQRGTARVVVRRSGTGALADGCRGAGAGRGAAAKNGARLALGGAAARQVPGLGRCGGGGRGGLGLRQGAPHGQCRKQHHAAGVKRVKRASLLGWGHRCGLRDEVEHDCIAPQQAGPGQHFCPLLPRSTFAWQM